MLIHTLLEQDQPIDLRLIARKIASECSEFLSNPTMLLRGIQRNTDFFVQSQIRVDRVSRSGRNVGQLLFNAMVEEEFQVSDIRTRCHFVTNTLAEAHKYGDPYLAFPTNGARVLHNPSIADSINTIGEIWYMVTANLRGKVQPGDVNKIQDAISRMDQPGATIDILDELYTEISPAAAEQMQIDWDRAKNITVGGYDITGVNAIPKYSKPVEYMVFGTSHTNLVHLTELSKQLGTYDGSTQDTFDAFIQYIQSI